MAAATQIHQIKSCSLPGCCTLQLHQSNELIGSTFDNSTLDIPTTTTAAANLPSLQRDVSDDIYDVICHIPKSVIQWTCEIWSHISGQPKRPSWDFKTAVLIVTIQTMRDQTITISLNTFRTMTNQLFRVIAPLNAIITPYQVPIRFRNLPGLLNECDKKNQQQRHSLEDEEDQSVISGEWVSCEVIEKSKKRRRLDNNDAVDEKQWFQDMDLMNRCKQFIMSPSSSATTTTTNNNNTEYNYDEDKITSTTNEKVRDYNDEKVIMYIHGGGYIAMSAKTHRCITHNISKVTGRRVFAFDYGLSPEVRFPGALYDTVQVYLHLIDPLGESLDPKNITVIGDSAGGTLCLALSFYLRDHGFPLPEGLVLLSPWVDLTFSYPSWKDADVYDYLPGNPSDWNKNPALLYLEEENYQRFCKHPYVSPLFAQDFEHLPPILIQYGGAEALRDEIKEIVKKLKRTRTTVVQVEEYEDMPHVFQLLPLDRAHQALANIGRFVHA